MPLIKKLFTLPLCLVFWSAFTQAEERVELSIVPNFYDAFERNFNPYFADKGLHTTEGFIYEPLVIFNEMKNNTPVMRLASHYQFSSDLKTLVFFLRPDVSWSDGKRFDADDVIFSYQILKQYPELDRYGVSKWIGSMQKLSEHVVAFHLTDVNTNIPYEMSKVPIVAEHIWREVDPINYANENPVGTGPFTEIEQFSPQLYIQCKNPHYWDNNNLNIDCLRVPQISNNVELVTHILKSDLDWSSAFIPDIENIYRSASEYNKYWSPPAGIQAFMFNFDNKDEAKKEALNDVNFRRAFSMSIDRQAIIDVAFYGQGRINDFASGLGYGLESWSDKSVYEQYRRFNTFDVEGAKSLLAQSGYLDINNDGFVETPSGKSFQLQIQSPNGWTDFNNVVQLVVNSLNEVGINSKAIEPEFNDYNQAMINANYDVAYTNYFNGADPYIYWSSAYNSAFQTGKSMPRYAMHFFKNEQLDQLIESFYKTPDIKEQIKISQQIQKIVAENQVTAPTISGASTYQYNTKRFNGWWNELNPKGRPQIWSQTPERLLHVLDLKPN